MNTQNPFADNFHDPESGNSPPPDSQQQSAPLAGMSHALCEKLAQASHNPLIGYASPLLTLSVQLRNTAHYPNVEGLRKTLIEEIERLNENFLKHGVEANLAKAVSYNLCAFLDETVLYTPWGNNSLWRTQGLSVEFYRETLGGEKFFMYLEEAIQKPTQYLNLLEFLYLCLSLGFKGKYRHSPTGETELATKRQQVYEVLRAHLGFADKELSPHWKGLQDNRNALTKSVSPWWFAAIGSGILGAIFFGFYFATAAVADLQIASIDEIILNTKQPSFSDAPPSPPPPVIAQIGASCLEKEHSEENVCMLQEKGKTIIRLRGAGMFASGDDQLLPESYAVVDKISAELTKVSGQVKVIGYTDSVPIKHSRRFASNQELSEKRAQTVTERLKRNSDLKLSIISLGRGEKENVAPNDTKENQAKNRRVEISF